MVAGGRSAGGNREGEKTERVAFMTGSEQERVLDYVGYCLRWLYETIKHVAWT